MHHILTYEALPSDSLSQNNQVKGFQPAERTQRTTSTGIKEKPPPPGGKENAYTRSKENKWVPDCEILNHLNHASRRIDADFKKEEISLLSVALNFPILMPEIRSARSIILYNEFLYRAEWFSQQKFTNSDIAHITRLTEQHCISIFYFIVSFEASFILIK